MKCLGITNQLTNPRPTQQLYAALNGCSWLPLCNWANEKGGLRRCRQRNAFTRRMPFGCKQRCKYRADFAILVKTDVLG